MFRRTRLLSTILIVAAAVAVPPLNAQTTRGTLVMAFGREPTHPIPYIGPALTENADIADQLFLRLAALSPATRTTGDDALVPELASSWHRVNSTTVDFVIDARAHWHDGVPITSNDVVFTWKLIKTPALGVDQAPFSLIDSVTAIDSRQVRFHYSRPSAEQVYVAGFLIQPLPAHLLDQIDPAKLATSDYVAHPVGDGPFKYERRVPGRFLELRADPDFFLGRPGISRLVIRFVPGSDAQLNLLLSGEVDVMASLSPTALSRASQRKDLQIRSAPSNSIMYLLFNSKVAGDRTKDHPILNDVRVRRALALAIDRRATATTIYGQATQTPRAIRSQAWYWIGGKPDSGAANPQQAKELLEAAGWHDTDGDGIRDRDGKPLSLKVIYPSQSTARGTIATQVEQWWRAVGVDARLTPITGPVWVEQRNAGQFDVDITNVNQDPSPSSLVQSWSCASAQEASSSNVGHWCDPNFDRLLRAAENAPNPVLAFRRALDRMADWQPAVVVAAPINAVAVHTRFENVIIRPAKNWTHLWQWTVKSGAALSRDR